ncbi:MAG: hypothetical protein KC449_27190 [Anaerolineales bacterium]|nr:hypothetical protein [Anaerolineales bacterium]
MDRLEREFEGEIEFFVLNVDLAIARRYMDEYAIRSRSTYVLLDGNGEEVTRWSGPLDEDQVSAQLAAFLESLE